MAKAKKVSTLVEKMVEQVAPAPLRLDFGCGKNKREGFTGVDQYPIPGVDVVLPLFNMIGGAGQYKPWPWADNSVDEANASHFIEHLTNFQGRWERVYFFNELWRILKPGAKCALVLPHWASNRYYGDPTHCEPFSEMGFYYLSKDWRLQQTPHVDVSFNPNGYSCDFDATWGYSMHQSLLTRNSEYQQYALANYKEAAQDMLATLTAKK